MEHFRQIGEVLGSLNALMVFRDNIRINQRQCCLLVDVFNLGFEGIAEEIKQNLKFDERPTKWKALEQPLKELHRIFREGEQYVCQCLETKDWWAKAVSLSQNTDCVQFHIHNLLWCLPIVFEAIEFAAEISGCDQDEIQIKWLMLAKKYERDWMDPMLFQRKFGKQYLVSHDIHNRIDSVWREDRWVLLETIAEKRSVGTNVLTKQEIRVADLLSKNLNGLERSSNGKLFPSSILVGAKDYQVRRRLGSGSQYKEIQWMGEIFAVRHFFGEIEPLIPEISRLSSLAHPNIMHFLCGFSDEEKKECFLVMELMSKDLYSFIKEICSPRRRVPFTLPVAVDIMLQIARGMEYLHSHKIYHGDLNPCNILVRTRNLSSEGYLHTKVAGFGLTSVRNFTSRTSPNPAAMSPLIWYAPEVLSEQEQPDSSCDSKYTEKADVYSFGMICFELLTGKVPFEDGHLQGDKMSRNIRAGERPLFPFPTPKYLTSLTKKCWHADPIQRPSFSSICRILRYIKRFLVMNPNHSQPDAPVPVADYFDLEMNLSKKFTTWASVGTGAVMQIPFQMFAYRIIEKERTEKTTINVRDKSSESGSSEGASVCGDENGVTADDPFSTSSVPSRSSSLTALEPNKKTLVKKSLDGKANRISGQNNKGRALRPPQMTPCGHSLRMNSESQLQTVVMSPTRRRTSGHASDSELT
ncbi:uncharacterized protein LOC131241296 [Magnolia sinica]|uniref:uncharacterized protein LOC131241296 n=1 Tax=Magnolia sinica TaxID=86752 RepID=UPI00265A64BB|nr:uncharacterized protein LOC131241296 [Magnolia sinica]